MTSQEQDRWARLTAELSRLRDVERERDALRVQLARTEQALGKVVLELRELREAEDKPRAATRARTNGNGATHESDPAPAGKRWPRR